MRNVAVGNESRRSTRLGWDAGDNRAVPQRRTKAGGGMKSTTLSALHVPWQDPLREMRSGARTSRLGHGEPQVAATSLYTLLWSQKGASLALVSTYTELPT